MKKSLDKDVKDNHDKKHINNIDNNEHNNYITNKDDCECSFILIYFVSL